MLSAANLTNRADLQGRYDYGVNVRAGAAPAAFTEQHWSLHMDILAHGLWAGIAVAVAARLWKISCCTAVATVAMAVLPDLA